jgi:hypothetical protein
MDGVDGREHRRRRAPDADVRMPMGARHGAAEGQPAKSDGVYETHGRWGTGMRSRDGE